jgi:hypothetical protein
VWLSRCSYTAQTWELVLDLLLVLEPRGSGSSRDSYSQSVSADLPSDPTVKPCLGQSELFSSQNASIKLGMHGAVQSSHVGALVKWPRNDELRIMKATRMAQKIFHAYLKAKDCPFHRYWGAMSCIRNRNFSRSFPFTRFHLLAQLP